VCGSLLKTIPCWYRGSGNPSAPSAAKVRGRIFQEVEQAADRGVASLVILRELLGGDALGELAARSDLVLVEQPARDGEPAIAELLPRRDSSEGRRVRA
jgi:hypothetical protein